MTIARRKQVCLDITPVYHCVYHCVRRSWIEDRLLLLAEVFCIEIAGYAILSNHYHVVLHIDKDKADNLSDDEVIARWLKLYKGPEQVQRYVAGESLNRQGHCQLRKTVAQWRDNLSNISRFMGNLNEYIARKASKEDNCKGAFWGSRFKLQAVLDVPALLQTLCYVDLNPVRAIMAKTPEESKYTSVRRRLHQRKPGISAARVNAAPIPGP